MSFQITTAFVKQFGANIYTLAQQKGSRLRPCVRRVTQVGKSQFFDQIGAVTAVKKVSRHSDTPQIDTPHSRRRVTMSDYEWADLIDQEDKVRLLIDPESAYVQAAMWALGRSTDDEIIAAHDGTAYTGEEGTTTQSLGNAQKIVPVAGTAGVNMNVGALIQAKQVLDAADIDPDMPRYIAVSASQIASLLGSTQVTSSDFNSVKALVEGKIDTFMGFKFVRTERLALQSGTLSFDQTLGTVGSGSGDANGYRKCFAWAEDGLICSIGMDMMSRVSERADKSYSTQAYAAMSVGATRMEEKKVVQILCKES